MVSLEWRKNNGYAFFICHSKLPQMRISLLLILLPYILHGQAPPKRCSLIRVKNVTFKEAVTSLLDAGYFIEKIDSNFLTIRTEPQDYSKTKGGMISIDIRIKDSTAFITGHCGLTRGDFDSKGGNLMTVRYYYEIENRGMKGSIMKESFDKLNEFALSFKKEIVYE